jgi:trimethylamine corrinoid protein
MTTIEARFEEAQKAIIECDAKNASLVATEGLADGIDPVEFLNKGFIPGINEVGELFGKGRLFLPELIIAAEAMRQVTDVINGALEAVGTISKKAGKILMATVQGDVHDIGKTIVVSLFKANGFEVLDLGRDISNEKIIEEAVRFEADIIGTSALLTTTMPAQQKLEKELKKAGLKGKIKTIVGGAPVTQRWAQRIGADAYAQDASDGVQKAKLMLGL